MGSEVSEARANRGDIFLLRIHSAFLGGLEGVLRNSSRISETDQEWPEFVYFTSRSVTILTKVSDSFKMMNEVSSFATVPRESAMATSGPGDPERAPPFPIQAVIMPKMAGNFAIVLDCMTASPALYMRQDFS